MSILARLATAKVAATTMAVNFWPWLLGAALVGAGTVGYGTFMVTRAFYQRDALQARLDLSNFRGELARSVADGKTRGIQQLEAAHADMAAWGARIEQYMDRGFSAVRAGLAADNEKLRGLISDPKYDCLRVPLPADYLRLLSRPGGSVPAGDYPHSGPATGAGELPPAAGGGAGR